MKPKKKKRTISALSLPVRSGRRKEAKGREKKGADCEKKKKGGKGTM